MLWCGKTKVHISFTANLTILHLVWIDFSVIVYLHNLILLNPLQFLSKIICRKKFLLAQLFLHIFSFFKSLEDISSFCRAADALILDFW